MPELPREIEVERVMNLVQGFGWVKVKEELIGDEIHLTVKKRWMAPGETPVETPGG